jgi:hypothetical protein
MVRGSANFYVLSLQGRSKHALVWLRHKLETMKKRLKVIALEKAKTEKEAHGEYTEWNFKIARGYVARPNRKGPRAYRAPHR